MEATFEERKEKALEAMQKLDIYKPYINGFKHGDKVCWFENFTGFWAYQDKELINKVKEIETKYDCTVYAVTHEITEFGELYSMLLIPKYKEDWDYVLQRCTNGFYAYAYVWNKSDNVCSEFGDIVVQSFGGGIRRVA